MKNTVIKGFKAVDFMREVRDKISMDTKDMNFEEVKMYMENRRLEANARLYLNATHLLETKVVAENTPEGYVSLNDGFDQVKQHIKSISASESAKLAFNRLDEKYNCTFDNKYTK